MSLFCGAGRDGLGLIIPSAVVFRVYSHIFYSIFTSIFKCSHVARRKYSVPWCIVTLYPYSIPASPAEYNIDILVNKYIVCIFMTIFT